MKQIFTQKWFEALAIRLIRTFAEGCIAVIGTNAVFLNEVNWIAVVSGGAMSAVLCLLFALKGLPEVGDAIEDSEKK